MKTRSIKALLLLLSGQQMVVPYGVSALGTSMAEDSHEDDNNGNIVQTNPTSPLSSSEKIQNVAANVKDYETATMHIHHAEGRHGPMGVVSNKEETTTSSERDSFNQGRIGSSLRGGMIKEGSMNKIPPPDNSSSQLRLQKEPCVLLLSSILMEDQSHFEEVGCYEPSTNHIFRISGMNQNELLDAFHNGHITSGQTTLIQEGAHFNDQDATLTVIPELVDSFEYGVHDKLLESRRPLSSTGTKNMLVLRVVAPDGTTPFSESEISNAWYGGGRDQLNLKSQYAACSFNKLLFNPATAFPILDGVLTVTIRSNVVNANSNAIQNAAYEAAKEVLGDLPSQYDHVAVCLPNGTTWSNRGQNWVGYANLNSWISAFNNKWCNSVSIQMHEIGHNLGLHHSNEGDQQYGDQSGYMGYSYIQSETPRMCFNGPKSWQLGWYDDRNRTVSKDSWWVGNLYGAADFGKTMSSYLPSSWEGDTMILKIPGEIEDWYVSFNRKAGINAETREGGDQVLVHKVPNNLGPNPESQLMAKLSQGDTYNAGPLPIKVSLIKTSDDPAFSTVEIGRWRYYRRPNPFTGDMKPNDYIISRNSLYYLIYQLDGNLVLYKRGWIKLWSSNTGGEPTGFASMHDSIDANLVVYAGRKLAIWFSETTTTMSEVNRGSKLFIQNDGNMVIYRPDGVVLWATNTAQPRSENEEIEPIIENGELLPPVDITTVGDVMAGAASSF